MWKSLLAGALGLAALEFILTLPAASQGRLGALLKLPATLAEDLMSPAVPLIPDLSKSSDSSGGSGDQPSSSTSSGPNATPISTTAPKPTYAPVIPSATT